MGKAKVIHIDSELSWRGGQQQAAYLFADMVSNNFKTILICQPESRFSHFCQKRNLPYKEIKMKGEIDLIAGARIAGIAKDNGYQFLHAHSAHALTTAIWTRLFYPEIKIIGVRRVDFHLKKNIFSKLKYNTKLVDKIVCISNEIKQVLLNDGIPESKLEIIHSGVNTKKFDGINKFKNFKTKFSIPEDHFIIGTVAALVGHKDYPNLLHAAEIVLKKHKKVTFIALGSGKNESEIKALHKKLKLAGAFKFLGFRKDVGEIMKCFDIFVLASKLEGLGTSILDAQSLGLPVVCTNAGGIPEIVDNFKNGIVVPSQNSEKLANALLSLVENKSLRNRLSENAKKNVDNFSINKTIQKNIELYNKLINES